MVLESGERLQVRALVIATDGREAARLPGRDVVPETRSGPGLEEPVITVAGGFLFIPPDVPRQPINLSETAAAQAIAVRNDPNEHEHVILYEPGHDE